MFLCFTMLPVYCRISGSMSVDESLLHQPNLGDKKLESFSLNSWSQVRNIRWRVLDKAPY
jgi:hypothetical protein